MWIAKLRASVRCDENTAARHRLYEMDWHRCSWRVHPRDRRLGRERLANTDLCGTAHHQQHHHDETGKPTILAQKEMATERQTKGPRLPQTDQLPPLGRPSFHLRPAAG